MKTVYLTIILFSSFFCQEYRELIKYSTASVVPGTRVYLDIRNFEVGEPIILEFVLKLFFVDDDSQRESYKFQIDQISADTYNHFDSWNNLRYVINKNVTKIDMTHYIFKWTEVKQPGKNYIYINPITPFENYYNFWKNEIDIKNIKEINLDL